MFKWLKAELNPHDEFHCAHCGKKTPGRWCGHCVIEPARGWYYDEYGHQCKPTAILSPLVKERYKSREVDKMIHVFDLAKTAKEIVDILAKHNVPGNLVEDVFHMAESMIGEQVVRSISDNAVIRNKPHAK